MSAKLTTRSATPRRGMGGWRSDTGRAEEWTVTHYSPKGLLRRHCITLPSPPCFGGMGGSSDTEGRFSIAGLPAVTSTVEAHTTSASSEPVVLTIGEGEQAETRLVVQEIVKLQGKVVGPSGGVPGAKIIAFSVGLSSQGLNATSDVTGAFDATPADACSAPQTLYPGAELVLGS